MSVISVQLRKQSVPGSKKAFSLVLSTVFLTVILGSSVIGLAQEKVKAAAQDTGGSASCSAAESASNGDGRCTQAAEDTRGLDSQEMGVKPPAGAPVIYSNFGPSKKPFDPSEGLAISGPNSQPGTQAIGIPFTPSANLQLEGMELPIEWYSGLNSVEVCIYADVNGLPGVIVQCVTIYNMFPWGGGFLYPNCLWELPRPFYPWPCFCYNVWDWQPFPLTGGVRYWAVVYPDPYEPDFWGYWNLTAKHVKGEIAVYTDANGWQAQEGILPAIALFGK